MPSGNTETYCHFPLDSCLAWVVYGSASCERRKEGRSEGSTLHIHPSLPCMLLIICAACGVSCPPPSSLPFHMQMRAIISLQDITKEARSERERLMLGREAEQLSINIVAICWDLRSRSINIHDKRDLEWKLCVLLSRAQHIAIFCWAELSILPLFLVFWSPQPLNIHP